MNVALDNNIVAITVNCIQRTRGLEPQQSCYYKAAHVCECMCISGHEKIVSEHNDAIISVIKTCDRLFQSSPVHVLGVAITLTNPLTSLVNAF